MSSKVGYALAGVSKFGEFCLQQYRGMEDLELVAVWNRTAHKAAEIAAKYGLRHHPTLEALVSDPDVALVHVTTIPSLHAAHAMAALENGKHVLCEKPLATVAADAETMIALANIQRVRLGINFVMRYSPLWAPIKTLVLEQVLGAPLRAEVVNCAGDSGLPAEHWFWDETLSGGIFVEHGVHFFDLITTWFGDAGAVTAADRLRRPGTALIEQVSCNVRYHEQTSAGFYHGFHQFDCLDRQQVRLIFERGELLLSGWIAGELQMRAALEEAQRRRVEELFPDARIARLSDASGPSCRRGREERIDAAIHLTWSDPRDGQALYAAAIRDLMADFIAAIRNPAHVPRVNARDGVAALKLAVQALELSGKTSP
ncbi:MAG: Gfo/Idh/MocA family oxidoreductase [Verrucomicrobiota bacterium]|nr:Gfo/Idh/MocA family oxidoreductase [Verrucomicrobiota bacterium]